METRQELDKKTRLTLMALKSYQTRTLLTVLQRQYNERLILENKFKKEFVKLIREYEEKVLETYRLATENGTPNYNITILLQISNTDFKEKYEKLLYKHLLLVEKNARNQTEELIKLQKRKTLGQRKNNISFKDFPITWLSTKAQSILTPIQKKPYILKENKPVKKYLRQHAITTSQKTAQRIDKNINQILTLSETEGINSRGVAQHLIKKFKQLKTWEAERIARTEINSANNLVTHTRLLESKLVDYKQWITAQDHRVRGLRKKDKANHVILNGEIARIGEPFSNGLQYPGDKNGRLEEFINCRCTLIPYIPDFDMIAPAHMTTFHESDMQRLPTNKGEQITLQLQENIKLYEVMEGYMKLYPDKIKVEHEGVKYKLNQLINTTYNTLDDILSFTKTTVPPQPVPLEEKTFKQLDTHMTTQIKQITRIKKRHDQRRKLLFKKLDKIHDKEAELKEKMRGETRDYLVQNYEKLFKTELTSEENKKYNELKKIVEDAGVKLPSNLDTSDARIEFDYAIIDSDAHLGLIARKTFIKLHQKILSSAPPEEYQQIVKKLENATGKEKKELEIKRIVFIKRNTPKEIQKQVNEIIKEKHASQLNSIQKQIENINDKLSKNTIIEHDRIQKVKEKINTLAPHYRNKVQEVGLNKVLSNKTERLATNLTNQEFHAYDELSDVEYNKLAIIEGRTKEALDETFTFYTDDSKRFNKYINLKNTGVSKSALRAIVEEEFNDSCYMNKEKYEGIETIEQLQKLWDKREKELIQKAKPLGEGKRMLSAQNNAHYEHLEVGDTLPDTGFISYTLNEGIAEDFANRQVARDHDVAIIKAYIEADVEMTAVLQASYADYGNEQEYILPPGYEMIITDKRAGLIDGIPCTEYDVLIRKKR